MASFGSDLSVVVQGPVHGRPEDAPEKQRTRQALASVRQAWPAAEIILSTWKGTDTRGLTYDLLVENEDPGTIALNDTDQKHVNNNLNRQITSTRGGLARASRPYAIKLRSDCLVTRPLDPALIENLPRLGEWSLLKKPIATTTICSRNPLKRPVLFHISDLFHFGLREDVITLWSAPLVDLWGFTRSIDPAHRPAVNAYSEGDFLFRCAPEQYIGENLVRLKYPAKRLRHHSDGSTVDLVRWLRIVANNFVILSESDLGIQLSPHLALHGQAWDIFNECDHLWLDQWRTAALPLSARAAAAREYFQLRLNYRRPSVATSALKLWGRLLYRLPLPPRAS